MLRRLRFLWCDTVYTFAPDLPGLTWNLFLAAIPVGLGLALVAGVRFRHRATWWVGAALFVLFLPNAPYLLTDLVHLRPVGTRIRYRPTYVLVLLPVFAALVSVGLLAYGVAMGTVRQVLRRAGWWRYRWPVEAALHGLSAFGVLLGRVGRLNSWNVVTHPRWSLDAIERTLRWPWFLPWMAIMGGLLLLTTEVTGFVGRLGVRRLRVETARSVPTAGPPEDRSGDGPLPWRALG